MSDDPAVVKPKAPSLIYTLRGIFAVMIGLELLMIVLGPASRLVFEGGMPQLRPLLQTLAGLGFMALLLSTLAALISGVYLIAQWSRKRVVFDVYDLILMIVSAILWQFGLLNMINYMP